MNKFCMISRGFSPIELYSDAEAPLSESDGTNMLTMSTDWLPKTICERRTNETGLLEANNLWHIADADDLLM